MYPGEKFDRYTVLGDDVVIADESVARVYEEGLSSLGVTISYSKSLISHSGSAEFAKRFRVRGLAVDLSPISVRALLNSHHPYGLMAIGQKYPIKRFSTLCRIGGAGFRVLARLDHYRNSHFGRVMAIYTSTLLHLSGGWVVVCLSTPTLPKGPSY